VGLGVASVASTAQGTAALEPARQGLASGLLTTSAQVGTALGLAVIVPLAAARADALGAAPAAQVAGFELGFAVAAALAAGTTLALALSGRRAAPWCWARRPIAERRTGRCGGLARIAPGIGGRRAS
jgi:hypothetical protein